MKIVYLLYFVFYLSNIEAEIQGEDVTLEYFESDVLTIEDSATPDGCFLNFGPYKFWCVGDIRYCPNEFSLDFWVRLNNVPVTTPAFIILSNGGHSPYSNGFYFKQVLETQYELGVASEELLWKVTFRLQAGFWLHIVATFSQEVGLTAYIDQTTMFQNITEHRTYEEQDYDPVTDLMMGINDYGQPILNEFIFEIKNIKFYNKLLSLSDISTDEELYLIGCVSATEMNLEHTIELTDGETATSTCISQCAIVGYSVARIFEKQNCDCASTLDDKNVHNSELCAEGSEMWKVYVISSLTTADDFYLHVTCDMIGPNKYTLPEETVIIKIEQNFPKEVSYSVDFGDRTTVDVTDSTVSHSWALPGNYTVNVFASVGLIPVTGQTTCKIEYHDEGFPPENVFLSTVHNLQSFSSELEFVIADQFHSFCSMKYDDGSMSYDFQQSVYLEKEYIEHTYSLCGQYKLHGECTNDYGSTENDTTFVAQKFETNYHYITEGEISAIHLEGDDEFVNNSFLTRNGKSNTILSTTGKNQLSVHFDNLDLFENHVELWSDEYTVLDRHIFFAQNTLAEPIISSDMFNGLWELITYITVTIPVGNNIFLQNKFGFDDRDGFIFADEVSSIDDEDDTENKSDNSDTESNISDGLSSLNEAFFYIYEVSSAIDITFEVYYDSLSYYPLAAELFNDVSKSSSRGLVSVEVPIKDMSLKSGNIIDKTSPVTITINLNEDKQGPDKVTFLVNHGNGDTTEENYRSRTFSFTPFTHVYYYETWETYEICVEAYNEISNIRSCITVQVGQNIEYFEVLTNTPARVTTYDSAEIDLVCQGGSDRTFSVWFDDGHVLEVRDINIEYDISGDPYELDIESESTDYESSEYYESETNAATTGSTKSDSYMDNTTTDVQNSTLAVTVPAFDTTSNQRRRKRSADVSSTEPTTQGETESVTITVPTTNTFPTRSLATEQTTLAKPSTTVAADVIKSAGVTYVKRISDRVVRVAHRYKSPGIYHVTANVQNTFSKLSAQLCPAIVVQNADGSDCEHPVINFDKESFSNKPYHHNRATDFYLSADAKIRNCEALTPEFSWKATEIVKSENKRLERPIYDKICQLLESNNTLVIPARYLKFGLYKVTVAVNPMYSRLFVTENIFYLLIVPSPPLAVLSGDIHEVFYVYTPVAADFSKSKDPDMDKFDRGEIDFDIFCLAEIKLKEVEHLPFEAWNARSTEMVSGVVFKESTANAIRFHDFWEASCFDDDLKNNVTSELQIRDNGVVYISGDLFSTGITAFAFWMCATKQGRSGCTFKDFVVKKDNSSSALDDLNANLNNTSPAAAIRILSSVADIVTVSNNETNSEEKERLMKTKETIIVLFGMISYRMESFIQLDTSANVMSQVTQVKEENTETARESACTGLKSLATLSTKFEDEADKDKMGSFLKKSIAVFGNSMSINEEGLEQAAKRRQKRSTDSVTENTQSFDICLDYDHDTPVGELCYWIFDQNPIFLTIIKDLKGDIPEFVLTMSLKDCFTYIALNEEPDDIETIINQKCREEKGRRQQITKKTDKVVANLGKGAIDIVSSSVLRKSNTNVTLSITTGGMGIALKKFNANETGEKQTIEVNGASFEGSFAPDDGDGNGTFGTSVLFSEQNQFTYGENSNNIKTGVISVDIVKLYSSKKYEVNGTDNPMVIQFPGKPKNVEMRNFTRVEWRIPKPTDPMNYHEVPVPNPNSSIHFVLFPKHVGEEYDIYIAYNSFPNFTFNEYHDVIPKKHICKNVSDDVLRDAAQHTFYPPMEVTSRNGTYQIGVRIKTGSMDFNADATDFFYMTHSFVASCKYWDEQTERWETNGTEVSECTTKWKTVCRTTHLTSFGGDFAVPPNTINFNTVWSKFANLNENAAVFSTVIVLIGLYIITVIWARHMDKKDILKWGASPFEDNLPSDSYHYQVTVQTGVRKKAGTESNISLTVSGEACDTGVRRLFDGRRKHFARGSILNFVMSVENCLGPLTFLRIWHDNSGKAKRKGWFLDQIQITDLQTAERYFFLNDRWLAVEEDDGMVDRIIPVAGIEDLVAFKQLFSSSVKKKITSEHLWFSVFSRPTRSNFTRVQRISCCMSLLFLTMITNCMWFKSEETQTSVTSLTMGPFTFTLQQIFISFASTLIVFPVNFIMVLFFRRCRNKKNCIMQSNQQIPKRGKWKNVANNSQNWGTKGGKSRFRKFQESIRELLNSHQRAKYGTDELDVDPDTIPEPVIAGDPDAWKKKQKRKKKPWTFPYWCLYIAYFLCFLSITLSGFFTILYSMEWGSQKANDWLTTFLLSFFQSVIVVQPIKVLCIVAFIACILKKPELDEEGDFGEQLNNAIAAHDEEILKKDEAKISEITEKRRQANNEFNPPDMAALELSRQTRLNEIKMEEVLKEILAYGLFVIILFFLSYQSKDNDSFNYADNVKSIFTKKFDSISTPMKYWEWMDATVFPGLYAGKYFDGSEISDWRDKRCISDLESRRIGIGRLRQLRVKKNTCDILPEMRGVALGCRDEYGWDDDDTKTYEAQWIPVPKSNLSAYQDLESTDPWVYQSALKLMNAPYMAKISTYKGGGYVVNFERSMRRTQLKIKQLKDDNWIDLRTRAVFLEFTIFNPNVNLFAAMTMVTEFVSIGSAFHTVDLKVFRLFSYVGSWGIVVVTFEVFYGCFTFYFLVRFIKQLKKEKMKYFHNFWHVMQLLLLVLSVTVIAMYILKHILTEAAMTSLSKTNSADFVNFQSLALYDETFNYVVAFVVFLATIQFLKLLQFNQRMNMLGDTVRVAYKDLKVFSVAFLLYFFAFTACGYLLFGHLMVTYSSLISSAESMFAFVLGSFEFLEMQNAQKALGPLFFFLFVGVIYVGMMSIFLTIVADAFNQVKSDVTKRSNQYEIVDFIWKRLKAMMGLDH